jgi:Ni,Fe-hydrogenase III component G
MKFVAHFIGPEGCDYSIGCGHKIVDLKAESIEEADVEVKHMLVGNDETPEEAISYLLEKYQAVAVYKMVEAYEFNLHELIEALKVEAHAAAQQEQEVHDLAEFERLKAKFGWVRVVDSDE